MPVITVSQLNNYMKRYIDRNAHLSDLWVKGEISNFKKHYSGNYFFTIKDENSALKAIMFRGYSSQTKFIPVDGMKVIVFGKISVYEPSGTYQLYAESMIPDGAGELYAAYEQLKLKLESEGLFSANLKKKIPSIPKKVGVVTSISGAALRDILDVLKRRYPLANVCVYPAKVQGIGAADSICAGINYFSELGDCDCIIIARGGGSIEDLWAFNEEKTARAIFECDTPIISGVGHETDYTISDFVADVRAPTPSAAAELAVPSREELFHYIKSAQEKSAVLINSQISALTAKLSFYSLSSLKDRLSSLIDVNEYKLKNLVSNIDVCMKNKIDELFYKLSGQVSSLNVLNPLSVLSRGYSVILNKEGTLLDINKVQVGDVINVILKDGNLECVTRSIMYEEKQTDI